jgi:putative aldouronate transport system substrate-binding protein
MKVCRIFSSKLTVILVFFMSLSPLSSQTPRPGPKDSLTFSLLVNNKEGTEIKPDWLIIKEIERRKNIRFTIKAVPDAVYGKVLGELLQSNDIPDIVMKIWPDQAASFAAAGTLLPISDYEYLMPNFIKYIDANNLRPELEKLRDENGKYYLLPGYQREVQVQQWIYRKDLFDKHGLAIPASYDDLFQSLVFLKGKYPDSVPISACWGGAHLFAMMGAGYGISAGWNGDRMYDSKNDRWAYAPGTTAWREMFRFLNKCYMAGILDPELFTQDPALYNKKLVDGRTFVTVSWITSGFKAWDKQLADNGFPGAYWTPLMVPKSTIGIQALPAVNQFRKGVVIPARVIREPYFKALMGFLDWIFYSEEGRSLSVWGAEGSTYSVAGGRKSYLPTIKSYGNPNASLEASRDFGLNVMFDLCEVPDYEDSKKPPEIVEFLNQTLSRRLTARMDPPLTLSSDDLDTIKIFNAGLASYVNEMIKAFVTGTASIDSGWKDYTDSLEKKGAGKMENIWNSAWRKRLNAPKKTP